MNYFPCIVVDVETTGLLDNPNTRLIEIGAVALNENAVETAAFSSLVKPRPLMDRQDPGVIEAMKINGIGWELLASAPHPLDVHTAFIRWCSLAGWEHNAPITSYRLEFDAEMIRRTWPSFEGYGHKFAPFCVREEMKRYYHGPPEQFHLRQIIARLGIYAPTPAHRALSDARAAAALLRWISEQEKA